MSDQELSAWILPIADEVVIAIGRYELKYIEHVAANKRASSEGATDFFWRGRYIPVLNIAALVNTPVHTSPSGERIAAIVAYEDFSGNLLMGAIFLVDIPQIVHISADQSIAVDLLPPPWPRLAHAAFSYQTRKYPVLNLSALFTDQGGKTVH